MAELTKSYIVEDNTVRCTNRETKADEGSISRTFDIVVDFTGLCEIEKMPMKMVELALSTIIIRIQTSLRKAGDSVLKTHEAAKVYTVKAVDAGKGLTITRPPTDDEMKTHLKAKLAGMTTEQMLAYISNM